LDIQTGRKGAELLKITYCIRCGRDEERILDIVPGGTELETQVKTESRVDRTHSQ